MAVDPWAIDASAGLPAYTAGEMRLLTTTPFVAGAGASLGVRSGVRPSGSGTDLLVQAQSSPNMTVFVTPGIIVVQGSISSTQGAYTWALDGFSTRTIAAAHATLARTDLVVVRIRDAGVDTSGARDGDIVIITGTAGGGVPSLPTDATYLTLAQVAVPAAVSTIVAGNITDKRVFTTGLGGVLPCNSTTEPAANTIPPGQIVYRSDLKQYKSSDGAAYNHLAWSPPHLFVRRTTDSTPIATNTTLQDDTQLFVSVPANSVWRVFAEIFYSSGTFGDYKIGWSAPSGSTFDWNVGGPGSNQDNSTGIPYNGANTLAGVDIVGGAGGGVKLVARPSGLLVVGGTSGTFKHRWAQGTSDNIAGTANNAGSSLLLIRVG